MLLRTLLPLLILLHCSSTVDSRDKRYANVPLTQCRRPNFYNCNDTVLCIRNQDLCDGVFDCPLGDDEERCSAHECPPSAYKCSDTGRCLKPGQLCNGCEDCENGEDERNCTSVVGQCPGNRFYCVSDHTCIPVAWACDGVTGQCSDDLDERCEFVTPVNITLDSENPEFLLSANFTESGKHRLAQRIRVLKWNVSVTGGGILYAAPSQVSLGRVCGPSKAEVREGGALVAQLCGNSYPPWRSGHIYSHSGSFTVLLKFFNDFEEGVGRGLEIKFWQSALLM